MAGKDIHMRKVTAYSHRHTQALHHTPCHTCEVGLWCWAQVVQRVQHAVRRLGHHVAAVCVTATQHTRHPCGVTSKQLVVLGRTQLPVYGILSHVRARVCAGVSRCTYERPHTKKGAATVRKRANQMRTARGGEEQCVAGRPHSPYNAHLHDKLVDQLLRL